MWYTGLFIIFNLAISTVVLALYWHERRQRQLAEMAMARWQKALLEWKQKSETWQESARVWKEASMVWREAAETYQRTSENWRDLYLQQEESRDDEEFLN